MSAAVDDAVKLVVVWPRNVSEKGSAAPTWRRWTSGMVGTSTAFTAMI